MIDVLRRPITRPAARRGSVREFFGGDPALKGCWSLNGHAQDHSGNENHGTVTGAIPYIGKMGGLSYYFDGNDYITIPNSASIQTVQADAVTFMVWVEPRASANAYEMPFWKGDITLDAISYFLAYNVGLPYYFYFAIQKSGAYQVNAVASVYPQSGKRRFITAVYLGGSSGTNMFIYVDGILSGTGAFSTSGATACVGNLILGTHYTLAYYMTGIINNSAMFKRALSPIEISQYYQWATATPRKYWFYTPEEVAGHIGIWGQPAGHGLIR